VSTQQCSLLTCQQAPPTGLFRRRQPERRGYIVEGEWYCCEECLEGALRQLVRGLVLSNLRQGRSEPSLRPTLGLILLKQGIIEREELKEALDRQKQEPRMKIGELLRKSGVVQERDVTVALSRQYGLPWVNFVNGDVAQDAVRLLPAVVARTFRVVPIDYRSGDTRAHLAIVGPPDYALLHGVGRMLDLDISALVGDESKIEELLERFYPESQARGRILDLREMDWGSVANMLASFAAKYDAEEVRLERLGQRLWYRVLKGRRRRDWLIEIELPEEDEVYVS
jgi:hypothetical protein